ncbi:MAG: fatty acid desaturase family protein [Phaeodactylibacter sp.]|nr:fatty acid desaturase family protein [Phaeodactylibacter sp.]MCB9054169.1 fatty acid desaturase family protein [Lewinellaceae bacterium]
MTKKTATVLNDSIATETLKPLFQPQPMKHAAAMLLNWAIILGAIYLCTVYFHPIVYFLAVVVIGARMHALAILMHDATHYRFLKNRKWNDLITDFTTMYPLFTSIEQYRQNHLRHHKHLNTEHDPDWVSKLGVEEFRFPKTRGEFLWIIFSYLILYRGVKDAIWFLKRFQLKDKKQPPKTFREKLPKLMFYVVLFSALTALGGWKYYALFWVVPYFSTFFMFQYIRSVAEHFGELEHDHELTSSRTVKATAIEQFFLAPHNVGYHLEHHLYPGVPFYNLPALHNLLMQNPGYRQKAHITQGYWKGLMKELGA